jgi:hypothetical protein
LVVVIIFFSLPQGVVEVSVANRNGALGERKISLSVFPRSHALELVF